VAKLLLLFIWILAGVIVGCFLEKFHMNRLNIGEVVVVLIDNNIDNTIQVRNN
jgi:hypothetical protein